MTDAGPPITPDTRVAALLEAYPQLEELLIGMAPPFAKLRNPVLRRTIARVTSLRRAAEVAGLSPRDLVATLRDAAGLDDSGDRAEGDTGSAATVALEPPEWARDARVQWTLDADTLLSSGREPIGEIGRRVAGLEPGACGVLDSSFVPAPLLEWLEHRGYPVVCVSEGDGYRTWIGAADGG